MKTKITYIISDIDRAVGFEWIVKNLDKKKFELSFILLNTSDSYIERYLKRKNIYVSRIFLKTKKDYPTAFFKIVKELNKIKPQIVHTHLPAASLLGLSAAKFLGIKRRITTRHHSTINHDKYPKAVKWDKFVNNISTDIVAISQNVKNILVNRENVEEKKIYLIYHGFDFKDFDDDKLFSAVADLKQKYNIRNKFPVVGVIARYIYWKGHEYQIPAFKKFLRKYPQAHFIFANAMGPDKEKISKLLQENLPKSSYTEIKFEANVFALYKFFDIYVHTPVNEEIEAFGQTYVEALAAGIPSVFTLSGVAREFIKDRENALVVKFCDSDSIYNAMVEIMENEALRSVLIKNGKKSISKFDLIEFIKKLEKLYLR